MADESPSTLVTYVKTLSPAFKDLIAERFSREARVAQNLTILMSALGIAVSFGLITIKETDVKEIHFAIASVTAAVWLLLFTSAFFLARFLFLASRDLLIYRLKSVAASASMDEVAQKYVGFAGIFQSEFDEVRKIIANPSSPEELDKAKERKGELDKKDEEYSNTVIRLKGIMDRFRNRNRFIDKWFSVFEVGLPCALFICLFVLAIYSALRQLQVISV